MLSRKKIQELVMKESLSAIEKEYQSYDCVYCTHAIKELVTLPASEFHIKDRSSKVAVYRITCGKASAAAANLSMMCIHYKDNNSRSCATCRFGKPVYLNVDVNAFKDIIPKEDHHTLRHCRVTRTVYRCLNRSDEEHSSKGPLMSSYVRCKYYKNKGNAGHGKD